MRLFIVKIIPYFLKYSDKQALAISVAFCGVLSGSTVCNPSSCIQDTSAGSQVEVQNLRQACEE